VWLFSYHFILPILQVENHWNSDASMQPLFFRMVYNYPHTILSKRHIVRKSTTIKNAMGINTNTTQRSRKDNGVTSFHANKVTSKQSISLELPQASKRKEKKKGKRDGNKTDPGKITPNQLKELDALLPIKEKHRAMMALRLRLPPCSPQ